MSTDKSVTKSLLQTLEDGKEGFTKAAEKLSDGDASLAQELRGFASERGEMAAELEKLAATYGDEVEESSSLAATAHRGWLSLKAALEGSSAKGVLDAAEKGEAHAEKEYEEAVKEDVSPTLRAVIERQMAQVKAAHQRVIALHGAQS
jgi:uncharacterized protein (TIGR02284 family)